MVDTALMRRTLALTLACGVLAAGPVRAQALEPDPAPTPADVARDAAWATAASAAILGFAVWDGGTGPIGGAGPLGQLVLVGGVVALPPLTLAWGDRPYPLETYVAGLPGGLLGLGLGFALTRGIGGLSPTPSDLLVKAAVMALGQGIGSALSANLYLYYRPALQGLNELPEQRTDDPIKNWNLRRERQHP